MKPRAQSVRSIWSNKKSPSAVIKSRNVLPKATRKKPLDEREYPAARDTRGSASRQEIRRGTPHVTAPRQSQRPVERSSQKRSRRS